MAEEEPHPEVAGASVVCVGCVVLGDCVLCTRHVCGLEFQYIQANKIEDSIKEPFFPFTVAHERGQA